MKKDVEMATATWPGLSGRKYTYDIYELSTTWNDVAGNYIFAKQVPDGWRASYVGETNSFQNRFSNHEKWASARNDGATHVHAHTTPGGDAVRKAEEADLVGQLQPPCNDRLR